MSERVNQLRFPVTLTEKQYVELRDEAMKAGELRERARAAKAPAPSGGEAHPVTPTDPEQAAARFCFATSRRGNLSVTVEMEPDPSGPWVAWEDYAALLAERDRCVCRKDAKNTGEGK